MFNLGDLTLTNTNSLSNLGLHQPRLFTKLTQTISANLRIHLSLIDIDLPLINRMINQKFFQRHCHFNYFPH